MSGAVSERAWLNVDVPRDIGAELAVHSQALHRTTRQQLRLLIETFVNERRAAAPHADAPTPTPKTR
jgi:hypothetical protein